MNKGRIGRRLAALWVASAVWLSSTVAAWAEQKQVIPPKPVTRADAEQANKKARDCWNRKDSTLPDSALEHDRPDNGRTRTKTQRQHYRPQVLSAPEAETKQAKPKIPKAGRSQLPGSKAAELDPNGSKSDRQFNRKKTSPSWPRPQAW